MNKVYLPQAEEGDLLIWDNLAAHKCVEVQKLLSEKKILNICLPFGGHHQSPLDNMIFRQAKRKLKAWTLTNKCTREERNTEFSRIFETMDTSTVQSSFRKCIIDFWEYPDERSYLKYVREELGMDNITFELFNRQYRSANIDQFYIVSQTSFIQETEPKMKTEKQITSMEDDLDDSILDGDLFRLPSFNGHAKTLLEEHKITMQENVEEFFLKIMNNEDPSAYFKEETEMIQTRLMTKPLLHRYKFSDTDLNRLSDYEAWMTGTIMDVFGHTFADRSELFLQYVPCDVSLHLDNITKIQLLVKHIVLKAKGYVIISFSECNIHWNLLIFDSQSSEWSVFSSFSGVSISVTKFLTELSTHLPNYLQFTKDTLLNVLNITIQSDGYHCGDFCVMFLELLSRGWDLSIILQEMEQHSKDIWAEIIWSYREILKERLDRFDRVVTNDSGEDDSPVEFVGEKRKRQ